MKRNEYHTLRRKFDPNPVELVIIAEVTPGLRQVLLQSRRLQTRSYMSVIRRSLLSRASYDQSTKAQAFKPTFSRGLLTSAAAPPAGKTD